MMALTTPPLERKIRPTEGGADSNAFGGASFKFNGSGRSAPSVLRTSNAITDSATARYLASLDPNDPPHHWEVEADLIELTNNELRIENAGRAAAVGQKADANQKNQIPLLRMLSHDQVAQILAHLHRVVRLIPSHAQDAVPSDNDPLVIYHPQSGIYLRSNDAIVAAAAKYAGGGVQFQKDVLASLRVHARQLRHGTSHEWAAVANGDYHRATGVLLPFSPDRVFLSRVPVAYIQDAQNPVIHNDDDDTDWDVDSGLLAIADGDPGTEQLLWELLAAVAQPNVRTNKAVALYNRVGNNGKGTILQACRGIAGESNTLSASVATLAKDATLPLLSGKSLVVSDENATNDFVKNAETIKVLATRESFFVNPKYQQPYNATFEGTQVHCLNALPRFGDHTDSMWRRWLFIPLTAEFEGRDRKYIKDDYLHRPEVLQYILRRALELNFTGFSETDATRDLLRAAKMHNDAARQFWAEHEGQFAWDLLPLGFLYELFKAWFARDKPGGRVLDRGTFDESILSALTDSASEWAYLGPRVPKKASVHMALEEPLVNEYGLDPKWNAVLRDKQFRDVLYRDRVALTLARAARVSTAAESSLASGPSSPAPLHKAIPSPILKEQLDEVERLVAADVALWESRAVEEDGVTDAAHIRDHAAMRRLGSTCGGCKFRPQRHDDAWVFHSRDLDASLYAARAARADEAA